MPERRWISPKICSEYLGIHIKTVYAKIARGEIPAAKLGGLVLVDRKKLNELLENQILDLERKVKDWI